MSQKKLESMHGLPWTKTDEVDTELLQRMHYHRALAQQMEPDAREEWCNHLFDHGVTLEQWDIAEEHWAVQDALLGYELNRNLGFRPEPPPAEDPTVFGKAYRTAAQRYYMPSASLCPGCGRHTCWMGSEWKRYDTWARGREKTFSVAPRRRVDDQIEMEFDQQGRMRRYRWIRHGCKPKEMPWIFVDFVNPN
jgi:hypothetical protein